MCFAFASACVSTLRRCTDFQCFDPLFRCQALLSNAVPLPRFTFHGRASAKLCPANRCPAALCRCVAKPRRADQSTAFAIPCAASAWPCPGSHRPASPSPCCPCQNDAIPSRSGLYPKRNLALPLLSAVQKCSALALRNMADHRPASALRSVAWLCRCHAVIGYAMPLPSSSGLINTMPLRGAANHGSAHHGDAEPLLNQAMPSDPMPLRISTACSTGRVRVYTRKPE